jgi:hypothetical protein
MKGLLETPGLTVTGQLGHGQVNEAPVLVAHKSGKFSWRILLAGFSGGLFWRIYLAGFHGQ